MTIPSHKNQSKVGNRLLIQHRHADYLFTVKANQPSLKATIDRLPRTRFPLRTRTPTMGMGASSTERSG
jgi:hypothetical protein